MQQSSNNIVLSIAGFDPCAGAGVLADIQTFQSFNIQGMAVNTANTYQDEDKVFGIDWLSFDQIKAQLSPILSRYDIDFIKIGLIQSLEVLKQTVDQILDLRPSAKIIWDPIIRSSSGFKVLEHNTSVLNEVIKKLFLITPNLPEYEWLSEQAADLTNCNCLIKGGHSQSNDTSDTLLTSENGKYVISGERLENVDKHGTGCILSAAILANLALRQPLVEACNSAKQYISSYLTTSKTKLGKHYLVSI